MIRRYTELPDGRVVDGVLPLTEDWTRAWCCNAPRWCGGLDVGAACPCRGPVTVGHDPGDEDRR